MKYDIHFSLKLWISSYRVSNRLGLTLSNHIITYFYNLKGNSSEIFIEDFKKKVSGISNENFKERYKLGELDKSLNRKKEVLLSFFWKIEEQGCFYEPVELIQSKAGSELYEEYIYQTSWSRDKDVKVFNFNDADLEGIFEKLIITAKEILKLEALNAIKNELEFSDIYNPRNKVVLEKVADAYWLEIKNEESLNVEQFIDRALNKYIFRIYKDIIDPKKKERKIKNVAREKFRQMSKKLGE